MERTSKICVLAGNKGRELLSLAMKDALFEGFITYNPIYMQILFAVLMGLRRGEING